MTTFRTGRAVWKYLLPVICGGLLGACGQMGPLYLPEQTDQPQPSGQSAGDEAASQPADPVPHSAH